MVINMDYLIVNLYGNLNTKKITQFAFEKHERGTKVFSEVYTIKHKNVKIGTLLSKPYENSPIDSELNQLQFENHLFYQLEKNELQNLLHKFCDLYEFEFRSINRLDICIDESEKPIHKKIFNRILNKNLLVSGREKKITPHYISDNGQMTMTGITFGKRSSAKYFRMYNKTEYLKSTPKQYINDWHEVNKLNGTIWRYEYQLNSKFFANFKNVLDEQYENITWSIFSNENLKTLFELAQKNHFQLKHNSGKTETNKEKDFILIDTRKLQTKPNLIKRLKITFENKLMSIKRTVKSLLTEYYLQFQQNPLFAITLKSYLDKYNLHQWFNDKLPYYLAEFRDKSKYTLEFDFEQFNDDFELCI